MVTPVRGAKPPGALAPELAKPAVEIRQVIESRSKTDLYNREVRFDEKAASLAHPELRQVIDKGLPYRLSEKTAEGLRGHTGYIRRLGLGYPPLEALVDKGADPVNPPEVPLPVKGNKGGACQAPAPQGKPLQHAQQAEEPIEPLLFFHPGHGCCGLIPQI